MHVWFYLFKLKPLRFRVTFLCSSIQFTQNVDVYSWVVRAKVAWVTINTCFIHGLAFRFLHYNHIFLKDIYIYRYIRHDIAFILYTRIFKLTWVLVHNLFLIFLHTHTQIITDVHNTYTHAHIHTYMYTYIHTYIHTHKHTYIYTSVHTLHGIKIIKLKLNIKYTAKWKQFCKFTATKYCVNMQAKMTLYCINANNVERILIKIINAMNSHLNRQTPVS